MMAVRPAELLLPIQLALSGFCISARILYKDVFKVWLHVNSPIRAGGGICLRGLHFQWRKKNKSTDCSWKITSVCILKKSCTLHETGIAAAAAAFMARYKGAGGRSVTSLNVRPRFFQYWHGKWSKYPYSDSPCRWGECKKLSRVLWV